MEFVRIYDFATKAVTEIPASELSPDMVLFELPDVGRVYVRSKDAPHILQRAPVSPRFDEIARAVHAFLPTKLGGVNAFVQGLREESHPVGELGYFMIVAAVVDEFGPFPDHAAQVAIAHVALAAINNGDAALHTADTSIVPVELAALVIKRVQTFSGTDMRAFWGHRIDFDEYQKMRSEEVALRGP